MTGPAELPGERKQVQGIVAAAHAESDDRVVAGALAFQPQARRGEPHERVEPVGDPQQFAADLDDPVTPINVRELVGEHDINPIRIP